MARPRKERPSVMVVHLDHYHRRGNRIDTIMHHRPIAIPGQPDIMPGELLGTWWTIRTHTIRSVTPGLAREASGAPVNVHGWCRLAVCPTVDRVTKIVRTLRKICCFYVTRSLRIYCPDAHKSLTKDDKGRFADWLQRGVFRGKTDAIWVRLVTVSRPLLALAPALNSVNSVISGIAQRLLGERGDNAGYEARTAWGRKLVAEFGDTHSSLFYDCLGVLVEEKTVAEIELVRLTEEARGKGKPANWFAASAVRRLGIGDKAGA